MLNHTGRNTLFLGGFEQLRLETNCALFLPEHSPGDAKGQQWAALRVGQARSMRLCSAAASSWETSPETERPRWPISLSTGERP